MAEEFDIVARIVADDDTDPGAQSAENRLGRVERRAEGVGRSIGRWLTRGFAMLGGSYALKRLSQGIIGIQTEIQNAEYGMASLFSATYQMPIVDSLQLARAEVQGLRQDAAVGVGELQHYLQGYQYLLGPGTMAGMSREQIRQLTKLSLSAGFAQRGQEGLQLAPMDVVQALQGGASGIRTPIVTASLAAVGTTEAKFNAMKPAERVKELMRAFEAFAPGVELMGQSWDAQMSTLKDGVKELLRTVTRPLFDRWTEQLRKANDWIDRNRAGLTDIAERIGPKLVTLYDNLVKNAGTYAALTAGAAVTSQVSPLTRRGGLGQGLMSLLGLGGRGAAAAGGGGSVLGGLGGLLSKAGSLLGSLAVPMAIVTGLFLSLKGAFSEFPVLLAWLAERWGVLLDALSDLGNSFGGLTQKGSVLNYIGSVLVAALAGLLTVLTWLVRIITTLTTAFAAFLVVMGALARGAMYLATGQWAKASAAYKTIPQTTTAAWTSIKDTWRKPVDYGGEADDLLAAAGGGGDGTTINIDKVEINNRVETNEDPARILSTFDEMISRLHKYRRTPKRIPELAGG
jgi:hypothetical protein